MCVLKSVFIYCCVARIATNKMFTTDVQCEMFKTFSLFVGFPAISRHEQSQHGSHQDQPRDSGAGGHYHNAW